MTKKPNMKQTYSNQSIPGYFGSILISFLKSTIQLNHPLITIEITLNMRQKLV